MSNEALILKSDGGGRMLVPVERQVELMREFDRSGLSGPRFAAMAELIIKPSPLGGGEKSAQIPFVSVPSPTRLHFAKAIP